MKKYSFNKYSEKYSQLFSKEKTKLKKIFPKAKIEHIGSSSIKGLGGKGIIDIAISVPKKYIPTAIKILQKNNYNFRPFAGDQERNFFQKIIKYNGNERRVHIHLTCRYSQAWEAMIVMRDYLRRNKEAAKEYAQVKKEAVKHAKGKGKKYREYKKSFLDKIEKLALKDYSIKNMKKYLIVNPGSASRKYALYKGREEILTAYFERGASAGNFIATFKAVKWEVQKELDKKTYKESMSVFLNFLLGKKMIAGKKDVDAVGFRIVAPGSFFNKVRPINAEYVKKLKKMRNAAPLHIGPVLSEIEKSRKLLPNTRKIGVSDSAFHSTIPARASIYGLPSAITRKLEIRRFGYHGISVESVLRKVKEKFKKTPARIIVCHLGSGSSATAIKNGESIDTSMGFTPLEGLLMGTRPGDIGAGALIYIAKKLNLSPDKLDEFLNKKSGLLGVSEKTSDVRELLKLEKKDPKAALALEIFAYRIKKYIGAYTASLGGLDLLVFTATIGERSDIMRERICRGLEPMGIVLDKKKNKETTQGDGLIQNQKSKVKIAVIRTDETREIALKIQK